MSSVIEDHPQRSEIERAIIAGQTLRAIEKWTKPKISQAAIQRYRSKLLAPAVRNSAKSIAKRVIEEAKAADIQVSATEAARLVDRAAIAQPFITHIERKYARYERWMQGAESKDDFRALASLDTAETRAIQLQAQLAGALQQDQQTTTQVNVALVMPSTSQADRPALASGTTIDVEPCE